MEREFDAIRFLEDYNIPFWTEGKNTSPGWVSLECPFCDDSSNHGAINPVGGYFYCWRCGHHSLYDAVQLITGVKHVKPILKKYDYVLSESLILEKEQVSFYMPGSPLGKAHKKYLEKRNFDPEYIENKYGVLGTTIDKYYPYRIITPVYYEGDVVSFLGRDYTNRQELRHKDCPKHVAKIYHKNILYNLDNCFRNKTIVVEGAYDNWRFGDNTCATLGTGWTDQQALLLSRRFTEVFIVFDKGETSQKKAVELAQTLNALGIMAEVVQTEYNEPDDFPEDDVRYLKKFLGIFN